MAPFRIYTDSFVHAAIASGDTFADAMRRLLSTDVFRSARSTSIGDPVEPAATLTVRRVLCAFVQSVDTIWAPTDRLVTASSEYLTLISETTKGEITDPVGQVMFSLTNR
jgi:hypothetical protein